MVIFAAAQGRGECKKVPHTKICHTYPRMMKRGTVIPYLNLKEIQKYMKHMTHPMCSADISTFHGKSANLATSRTQI